MRNDCGGKNRSSAFLVPGSRLLFLLPTLQTRFEEDPAKYVDRLAVGSVDSSGYATAPKEQMVQLGRVNPRQYKDVGVEYTCPMDPEIRQKGPGACPKCGMALEPLTLEALPKRTEYTCPMHPEVIRSEPGACPICGMALEPREVTGQEANPKLSDMRRRFWISIALTAPLLILMLLSLFPGVHWLSNTAAGWIQFALATPVVLWAGWPFFERGWLSLVNRHFNMFTLIALGTGASYLFSVAALFFPSIIPASFRSHGNGVPLYFEPAAVITALVLLGQVLELRARSQTSSALKSCWG